MNQRYTIERHWYIEQSDGEYDWTRVAHYTDLSHAQTVAEMLALDSTDTFRICVEHKDPSGFWDQPYDGFLEYEAGEWTDFGLTVTR